MGIGFLVMAFDKNNDAQPIGTFQLPSDGKLMNCTAVRRCPGNKRSTSHRTKWNYTFKNLSKIIFKDAATHTFNNEKQLVTIEWIPPLNYLGTVVFRWASLLQHTVETEYANTNVFVLFHAYWTTYVQNVSTFWVKTESIAVSFVADIPTANPSQPSVAVTLPTVVFE
jgi:hypothetical protein